VASKLQHISQCSPSKFFPLFPSPCYTKIS
jgi:hypothetical protein